MSTTQVELRSFQPMPPRRLPDYYVSRVVSEGLTQSAAVASQLGGTALAETSPAISAPEVQNGALFTQLEQQVLVVASLGHTEEQASRVLSTLLKTSIGPAKVENARDNIINKSGVPNMAASVKAAITERRLPFSVSQNAVAITETERRILEMIAEGYSNGDIANRLRTPKREIKQINRSLFHKMAATGRTHSVRRSYELGIFKLPVD